MDSDRVEQAAEGTFWRAAVGMGMLRASAYLPLPVLRAFGAAIGRAAALVSSRARRVARHNLSICLPEMDEVQRERLVRRVLVHIATTALETGPMWQWSASRLAALEGGMIGGDLFERAHGDGRGVLIIGPHLGNWEFLLQYLARRGQLVALFRPPRLAQLGAFVRRSRERHGAVLEPAGARGVRQILRALSQGKVVAVMPDQVPDQGGSVLAPFFGQPAQTMTLVRGLLRHGEATPLIAYAARNRDGKFGIHFEEPPPGLGDDDPQVAATCLNAGIECAVRTHLDQYLWTYKRFRDHHRPRRVGGPIG